MAGTIAAKEVTRFLNAWFAVRQVIQAANFNHFQKAGLSATQFMTLNLLPVNHDGIAIGELARRMNLKPATVAKTVDSLEARQMLARSRSTDDGRQVLIRITDQGRKLQNAAAGQFRGQVGNLFRSIPAADRAGLVRGLESLVRAANQEPSGSLTRDAGAAPPAKRNSLRSPRS